MLADTYGFVIVTHVRILAFMSTFKCDFLVVWSLATFTKLTQILPYFLKRGFVVFLLISLAFGKSLNCPLLHKRKATVK